MRIEPVSVGLLRDDEIDALVVLARAIWHACYPGIITPEQINHMLAQRYNPALIRQLQARGDPWWVARAGEAMCGFAHAQVLDENDCKLDKLYVASDLQRHGIGALLLAKAEDFARRHGRTRLILRVNRHNAQALAAYRKYGFAKSAEVREAIGGGFEMDDFVMTKEL